MKNELSAVVSVDVNSDVWISMRHEHPVVTTLARPKRCNSKNIPTYSEFVNLDDEKIRNYYLKVCIDSFIYVST